MGALTLVALCLPLVPLRAQWTRIYGNQHGAVEIQWTHGVATYGVTTHRWRLRNTFSTPMRICFTVTRVTEGREEPAEVIASLPPGRESADPGWWTMSQRPTDPPVSGVQECSLGQGSTPQVRSAARPGVSAGRQDVRSQIADITSRSQEANRSAQAVVGGLADYFANSVANGIADLGRMRDRFEQEERTAFTDGVDEATSMSDLAGQIQSRLDDLDGGIDDANDEAANMSRKAEESRDEAATYRRLNNAVAARIPDASAVAYDGLHRVELARARRLAAERERLEAMLRDLPSDPDELSEPAPEATPIPAAIRTEPAVAPGLAAQPAVVTLRPLRPDEAPSASGPGTTAVTVEFVNDAGQAVDVAWLNGRGEPVPYARIEPGRSYRQPTYSSHVWLIMDASHRPLVSFLVGDANAVARIPVPPPAVPRALARAIRRIVFNGSSTDGGGTRRVWEQLDQRRFVEIYPDGTRAPFTVTSEVEGGVIAVRDADHGLEVYIPYRGSSRTSLWWRLPGDVTWNALGNFVEEYPQ